jgi:DNA-binding CsgD family transcriptional regulator
MEEPTLESLGELNILPNDERFLGLLRQCERPEMGLAIICPLKQGIVYASRSAETVLGHQASLFVQGGIPFLESITTPETMPLVLGALFEFISQSKKEGFDPASILIQDFPFDVVKSDGNTVQLMSIALGLTYTANADVEYVLCLVAERSHQALEDARSRLAEIKRMHNAIFEHGPVHHQSAPLEKLNLLRPEPQKLTTREKEILKSIANGLTSAQIAQKLFIAENTVETHRKNLLAKFEAKNIAELIKKPVKFIGSNNQNAITNAIFSTANRE